MLENTCCPACDNDIADLVISVASERQSGTDDDRHTRVCPHCGTELAIAVTVRAMISKVEAA